MKKIIDIISTFLIFLFVYAAVSKLTDYELFVTQIGQSPILTSFAGLLAWSIPLVELIISGLLVFESTRLLGLYAAFSILTAFTVYIFLASRFSEVVPCSCGGVLSQLNWNEHLMFNITFLSGNVFAILFFSSTRPNKIVLESKPTIHSKGI